jgi:hypothetical protein
MMETTPSHAWIAPRRYDTMWRFRQCHSPDRTPHSYKTLRAIRTFADTEEVGSLSSSGARVNQLRNYIRSVVPADETPDVSDREYLERFARTRDEAAFAALVGRYGGSVWSVCRRLVDCEHDAEDAF